MPTDLTRIPLHGKRNAFTLSRRLTRGLRVAARMMERHAASED